MHLKHYYKNLLFWAITFSMVNGQMRPQITGINLEIKRNGAFVQLRSTTHVNKGDITGWAADNGWFYLTIYNAVSDTNTISNTDFMFPITAVEAINTDESTQISFQIARSIETFEFYQSSNPPEILLSMRFPVSEIEEELAQKQPSTTSPSPAIKPLSLRYKRFRTALYITGTSLTFAGILEQDNKSASSWELVSGLTLLFGTYVYDYYIRPTLSGNS